MLLKIAILGFGFLIAGHSFSQSISPNLRTISLGQDENFVGFDLLDVQDDRLFVLAEHWHNIRSVPRATLKTLAYLHEYGNVRILAIEQGASTAYMINHYLASGDTSMLRHIARNTMFWGRENFAFFQNLRALNLTKPQEERVVVKSIDIEYKMESAIFVINQLIQGKTIPIELESTLGAFRALYHQTIPHREQFDALAVMFYYNKELVNKLVNFTYDDITDQPEKYETFFDSTFVQFATMIQDMSDGLHFDYTNPNTKYKFRDRLIYGKFLGLLADNPEKGILCVIGERHATRGSSIHKLNTHDSSPVKDQVMNIRISALYNGAFLSRELRQIHFNYPKILKSYPATLIKHDPTILSLKAKQGFDYTLFINEEGMLTRFSKVFEGEH